MFASIVTYWKNWIKLDIRIDKFQKGVYYCLTNLKGDGIMLIKCPECELQVSDKALSCPHCGMPLQKDISKKRRPTKGRMKLPNGFGSITEIKNKPLRKPFRVRVCVGKTQEGQPVLKALKPESMFKTYNEAYAALMEYNKNPYDLDLDMTVQQLYEKWTDEYFAQIKEASVRTITSAWAYCSSIYSMRVKDVRPRHIKGCIEDGFRVENRGKKKGEKIFPSADAKTRMKSMFNLMFDYALEHDIVSTNYARAFELSKDILVEKEKNIQPHIIFPENEIDILWDNVGEIQYVDWVLIQCYMGWRPQELATLRLDEINLDEWYMIAGMKTEAGKQRIVPIHSKIKDLVMENYKQAVELGSEFLFNDKGQTHSGSYKVTYDKYRVRFNKVISQLGLDPEHRPHDPRVTFVTRCKKAGVDEYALKAMVGHKIQDITESTYTIRDVEWLREDLEKMQ